MASWGWPATALMTAPVAGQLLGILAGVLDVHDALKAVAGAGTSLAAHQHDLAVGAANLSTSW